MESSNEHSESVLKKYLTQLDVDSQNIAFFLLIWSQTSLKTEIVKKVSKEILWPYFLQDFLYIQDFSQQLWKQHILKVRTDDSNEVSKLLLSDYSYMDIWVRDINSWLSLSSVWKYRIVLIENIDRMNSEAMNAFLKTCEEPLPHRVIIATTANKSLLLDTIVSRAVTIPFFDYNEDELLAYCVDKGYFVWEDELKKFVCSMSMWKMNAVDLFHQKLSENEELKDSVLHIFHILDHENMGVQYKTLLALSNIGLLDVLVDGMIYHYFYHDQFEKANKWLKLKKNININVRNEHLIFDALL